MPKVGHELNLVAGLKISPTKYADFAVGHPIRFFGNCWAPSGAVLGGPLALVTFETSGLEMCIQRAPIRGSNWCRVCFLSVVLAIFVTSARHGDCLGRSLLESQVHETFSW